MISIGTMIGNRYEVIERVGSGGMADVFRAKDHRLNRFVAVKVLKNEYGEDTKLVTKFHQEAQAVACLSHPNVVGVYDVGEEDEMHYIVMEFVDGITLKKYIEKKGKLSVREAVGIGLQIANGLEAAHSNHIIHRDIKPQNILISKDGTAKVSDFGIAKAASSNTITANAMGSVHYISPEQARGGFSDEKSDIYSLGVTMYEMLSGTLPFSGESAVAVALAHIQEDATPLAAIDATIPQGLSNIVAKCMQKKTELRYPTVADLIADMKMFLQDPAGEYGVIKSLYENAETIFIPSGDVDTLKAASGKVSASSEEDNSEEPEEDSDGDVDPKLEKALIIGSIVVAIIIGIVLIYMLGKFIGFWGGSPVTTAPPAPSASSPAEVSSTPGTDVDDPTVVPDISDMIKDQAIVELQNNDLQYKFTEQESDTVEKGKVIGTNPEIGSTVEKGSSVEVFISSGPKKVNLQSVMGETPEQARSILEAAGFTVKTGAKVYSTSVEKGKIAYSDPKGGARVLPGATITIYESKGPQETYVKVPDLIGKTKSQARAALEAKGLELGDATSTAYSSNVEKNRVCLQSKKQGAKVKKGTTVDITLSLGQEQTYSYYSNAVQIDSPFDYPSDDPAMIKIVLSQDGKTRVVENVKRSYDDFPLTIQNVKGYSASTGELTVYMNGSPVETYQVEFRRVAH